MNRKELTNKIKCLECGEILQSSYFHDRKTCKCANKAYVYGGLEYFKFGGKDLDKIQVFCDIKNTWVHS